MSKLSMLVSKTIASAIIAVTAVSGTAVAAGCAAGQCRGKQSTTNSRCGACKAKGKQVSACAAKRTPASSVFPDAGPGGD